MRHALLIALTLLSAAAEAAPGDVARSFSLPPDAGYADGLAFDGVNLYVSNLKTRSNPNSPYAIFVVNPQTGALTKTLNTDPLILQDLTWNGSQLMAIELYYQVDTLDDTGSVVSSYGTSMSVGIAWDFDRQALWELAQGHQGDGGVANTLHLRALTGAVANSFTLASNAPLYGLAHDGCSLWTVDARTDELVRLDPTSGAELGRLPAPSPKELALVFDGSRLLVADEQQSTVYAVEIGPTTVGGVGCTPHLPGTADAGQPVDAGADAGEPITDAGNPSDGGGSGLGGSPDLVSGGDGGAPGGKAGGGCGCGASFSASLLAAFLVALGLGLGMRRRLPR